eukprot:GHVU01208982.1.p1 GENE.GHVU01208982.1~~GHVU01208982.1.p1  ORF type:complete len:393 (+),score=69.36 GHVU01208982.1:2731-3909(+)
MGRQPRKYCHYSVCSRRSAPKDSGRSDAILGGPGAAAIGSARSGAGCEVGTRVRPRRSAEGADPERHRRSDAPADGGGTNGDGASTESAEGTLNASFTADEARHLFHEDILSRAELRHQYENQLVTLRKKFKIDKVATRREVLKNVDSLISNYQTIASEAVVLARKERQQTMRERESAQRIAEQACKNFEKDLKAKTREALEGYRKMSIRAHDAAQRERSELARKCVQVEKSVDQERQAFEAQIVRVSEDGGRRLSDYRPVPAPMRAFVCCCTSLSAMVTGTTTTTTIISSSDRSSDSKEAEKRVASYRHDCESTTKRALEEKREIEGIFESMCRRIEWESKEFEATMRRRVLQVFWDKGVDIDEDELEEKVFHAKGVPLRSDIIGDSQQPR